MIKMDKWEKFKYHSDRARGYWLDAEIAFEEDRKVAAWRAMRNMYYQLFLAAEANYSPPRTEKQKRQQQLWQQRGLLERLNANLRGVLIPEDHFNLRVGRMKALDFVEAAIELNKKQMSSL